MIGLVGDNLGQFSISFGNKSKKSKKVPKSPLYAVDSFPSLKVRTWQLVVAGCDKVGRRFSSLVAIAR